MQLPSWFDAAGIPEDRRLQAQVFFPTGVSRLDSEDMRVLERLVATYRTRLVGLRVEFLCIGHADWRGEERFNDRLALGRADEVTTFVDRRLDSFPTFSAHPAHSRGERDAIVRGRQDRMAYDRRVDVWSTYVPHAPSYTLPAILITAPNRVERITFRVLESQSFSQNTVTRGESDGLDSWIHERLEEFRSSRGNLDRMRDGEEVRGRRRTERLPVSHRVNSVHFEERREYDMTISMEYRRTTREITYTWGPPLPNVTVTRHWVVIYRGDRFSESSSREALPRYEAEQDPLLFPPDPRPPRSTGR